MATNPANILTSILAPLKDISLKAQATRQRQRTEDDKETHTGSHFGRRPTKERKTKDNLPEEARSTLLTLHVLFPHVLLDALDLLDGKRVIAVLVREEDDENPDEEVDLARGGSEGKLDRDPRATIKRKRKESPPYAAHQHKAHYVLSTRPAFHTSKQPHGGSGKPIETAQATQQLEDGQGYTVHLQAWNCSCPAFALAAYSEGLTPGAGSLEWNADETLAFGGRGIPSYRSNTADNAEERREDEEQAVVPPVCKHLLAVLLGEIAPGLFGPFARGATGSRTEAYHGDRGFQEENDDEGKGVREVVVSRTAAAGIAAGMGSGR